MSLLNLFKQDSSTNRHQKKKIEWPLVVKKSILLKALDYFHKKNTSTKVPEGLYRDVIDFIEVLPKQIKRKEMVHYADDLIARLQEDHPFIMVVGTPMVRRFIDNQLPKTYRKIESQESSSGSASTTTTTTTKTSTSDEKIKRLEIMKKSIVRLKSMSKGSVKNETEKKK